MNSKFKAIGWDGIAMLLLSNLILVATMGLTFLLPLFYVLRIAIKSPITAMGVRSIIIPGMCLTDNQPNAEFKRRLNRAATLRGDNDISHIFILGGLTGGNSVTEAAAGKTYLIQQQVPERLLVLEEKSNNTLENFRFAKQLIDESDGGCAALVTSRYHLARCRVMADSLGIEHQLCGAEARFAPTLINILCLLKEAYHLHWYFSGRYWATLTGNKKMLARLR